LCVVCLVNFVSTVFANRKYEEIKPPEVEDFCYITDNTYSKEEVVVVILLLLVFVNILALDCTDFFLQFYVEGSEYGSRYIEGFEV